MARTWEWRMRSWAGTRSQRGFAEARVTLAAGVEAGPRTISQRGFRALATTSQPGGAALTGSPWGWDLAVTRAALGRGGRGGGGPRVQVKAAAGWEPPNNSSKAAGRELAIDPAQQALALIAQLKELGPQGPAGSCSGRRIGLIRFPIDFGVAISLI